MKNIRKITYGGLFIALAVLFPQIFHLIGGPTAGKIFLPMHIPVFLAGLIAGPLVGLIVGFISPLLSFLTTGMPPVPTLYFMLIELSIYGVAAGILFRKFKLNVYISLIGSMIIGRIVYGISIFLLINVFGAQLPKGISVIGAIVAGVPGLIIQIIIIPAIVYIIERRFSLE